MEAATMGRTTVAIKVENINDSLNAQVGRISPDQVRTASVPAALVDTGAKLLGLPKRLIAQLGLEKFDTVPATTSPGEVQCDLYRAVWLTVEGRRCTVDVAEVPDSCPALVGYVPLELLDFVVDPVQCRVIANPAHGGQQVLDLF
jgi:predicted aspartyl protease